MNNKRQGTAFEKEFAQMLFGNGFWAMNVPDDRNGQPFDIIGARNGLAYAFECKVCDTDKFRLSRVEVNQQMAAKAFLLRKNPNAYFVFMVRDVGIFITYAKVILQLLERGFPSCVPSEFLKIEEWFRGDFY